MSFVVTNVIASGGWAYYYDHTDNHIFRQKVCGISIGFDEDGPTKTLSRFVVAYDDGVVEHDVDLGTESDFLVYCPEGGALPTWSRLNDLVEMWYKINPKQKRHETPPTVTCPYD